MTAFAQNKVLTTTFVTVTISSEPGLTNFLFSFRFLHCNQCLSVCLSAWLSEKPYAQTLQNFQYMLPVVVAHSSDSALQLTVHALQIFLLRGMLSCMLVA